MPCRRWKKNDVQMWFVESCSHVPCWVLEIHGTWHCLTLAYPLFWMLKLGVVYTMTFTCRRSRSIKDGCHDRIVLIIMEITKENNKNKNKKALDNECVPSLVWPWPCIGIPFVPPISYWHQPFADEASIFTMPWEKIMVFPYITLAFWASMTNLFSPFVSPYNWVLLFQTPEGQMGD